MNITLKINQKTITLDVMKRGAELTVTVGEGQWHGRLIAHSPDQTVIEVDGRQLVIKRHQSGQDRQLWVDGQTIAYERILPGQGGGPADGGRLSAEIPAVVSQILVEMGQTVAAGEKLILLESMKMVIPLVAPTAGNVTAIHCAVGEAVQPGIPLIEVEKTE